jgi:hypothetical protein
MPSSVVAAIDYNTDSRSLKITYVSGMVYEYKEVPERIYKSLKIAGSKGRYLNYYIKGKYEFEKIEPISR